jgi:cytochrome c nitrite reductase small subunit
MTTMQNSNPPTEKEPGIKSPRRPSRLKISIIVNIVFLTVAIGALGGAAILHQSDTNPNFCGLCHVMKTNVTSYLTSNNLDHVHQQAGVQCKECHDYPVTAEIQSGVNYITGNYAVDSSGNLPKRKYDDKLCTKCHISLEHVAQLTDFLKRNPHDSHNGALPCSTCHVSHGAQIDYCSRCHDNGDQRLIGQPVKARGTIQK